MRRATRLLVLGGLVVGAGILAACGGGSSSSSSSSAAGSGTAAAGGIKTGSQLSGEITVLYTNNYVFNSQELAKKWWDAIAGEWASKYPNVKLNLVGVGGTDVDLMNKAALEFKGSGAPDVLQLPTTYVSQFGGSNYLLPLDKYVADASLAPWWQNFPKNVQDLGRLNGTLYAIDCGNNDSALVFNQDILSKAGVTMPWQPKTWSDVLDAARKVKQAEPSVWPVWVAAGVAAGPTNVLQGSGNLLFGTDTPTMFDDSSKKWVVDSPGLRSTLGFYQSVYKEGLGAPTSELFRPDAVGRPPLLFKDGKLAIAVGSNWYPTVWVEPESAAPWPEGLKIMGISPVPTENGGGQGGASTIGGWAFGIGSKSKNPDAAWAFIQMASEPQNMLNEALWSGFVPPDTTVGQMPEFVNYAPPFQAAFNDYAKYGLPLPTDPNFPVYARGLNTATGKLAQTPSTSVDDAIKILTDTVTQQLGSDAVTTIK
jgi:multiple sugar transport system substrate-binding protein